MNTILKEQLAREEGFEEGVQVGEQRGIEIGEQRGRKEVIEKIIEIYREELGFEEDKIMVKLIKDFNLTEEKAKEYLDGKNL